MANVHCIMKGKQTECVLMKNFTRKRLNGKKLTDDSVERYLTKIKYVDLFVPQKTDFLMQCLKLILMKFSLPLSQESSLLKNTQLKSSYILDSFRRQKFMSKHCQQGQQAHFP